MWVLAGCVLEGSPELVVSGPEGATLPGEGSWLHTDTSYWDGTQSESDLLFVDATPPELRCGTFRDEPVDLLPDDLEDLWATARDTFDAGDPVLGCDLQRDYYAALADWAEGPWGDAGAVELDLVPVGGLPDDPRLDAEWAPAYLDLVGSIDNALADLDCADRPKREAPTPYTLWTERARFHGRSGDVLAHRRLGRLVLEFDRFTLEADPEDGLEDLVLDGTAVLERCDREVEIDEGDQTVSGVE